MMIDSWAPQGHAATPVAAEHVLLDWFRRDVAQISELVPGAREHDADRGAPPPTLQRQFAVYCANSRAVRAYLPRARPIRIALICAATVPSNFADHPALRNPLLEDRSLGWASLTQQVSELRTASGDHYTMFAADRIAALAATVDEVVRSLEGGGRGASHHDPQLSLAR
jgi:hypothetical protein